MYVLEAGFGGVEMAFLDSRRMVYDCSAWVLVIGGFGAGCIYA